MADVSPRTLQIRLLILVFVAFLPAMGIFWYANRQLRHLQLQAKEQELALRAEVVAAEYRSMIRQSQTFLAALGEFSQIRSARFPACTEHLERILPHAPHFTTISLIGMDGYLACGSLTPETALYLGDRAYFIRASSREAFAVGEFAVGRITGKSVVGVAHPIVEEGQVRAVLAASLDLDALGRRSGERALPHGFTFTVLDHNRKVLVRLPRVGGFTLADSVGAIANEGFPEPPEGSRAVVVPGTDLDGMDRLFAVAQLRGPGRGVEGYVAVGRTRMNLLDDVDEVVGSQLRFLALGGALLLVVAWILGHFWLARRPPSQEEDPPLELPLG
jgi:hypothetical protein